MKDIFNKYLYKFAEWFFKKLYDEPTYEELQDKIYKLELKIEDLEDDLDYYKNINNRFEEE